MLGGGAEREGKVFMRGGAEGKAKLESVSLITRVSDKAVHKFYIVDAVCWVKNMWHKKLGGLSLQVVGGVMYFRCVYSDHSRTQVHVFLCWTVYLVKTRSTRVT